MRFEIKLRTGAAGSSEHKSSAHKLEIHPGRARDSSGGQAEFRFDGSAELRPVDWVEVTRGVYSIILSGRSYEARVAPRPGAPGRVAVAVGEREFIVEVEDPRQRRQGSTAGTPDGPQEVLAPMPGRIVKVLVEENQAVSAGDGLLVIEAMKMQNELRATQPGRVDQIYVREGAGVETGARLLRIVT